MKEVQFELNVQVRALMRSGLHMGFSLNKMEMWISHRLFLLLLYHIKTLLDSTCVVHTSYIHNTYIINAV